MTPASIATCADPPRPSFFARHDETGYSYVYRQPVTAEEFAQAEKARLACATESIGNDEVVQPQAPNPLAQTAT
jgi:4Fe-4S single cluster domain of Ferredoxin I